MSQKKKSDNDDIKEDIIIIKKERKYSPNNSNRITERIIQYFEDPKDAKALAEIKRLSNRAKLRSSKNIPKILTDLEDPDLIENTERNRILFKEPKNERAIKLDNSAKKNNRNENKKERQAFVRRTFQFPTQTYIPRNKNMSLFDEIKVKLNDPYKKINNDNELKFDLDIYEERPAIKEEISKEIKEEIIPKFKDENKDINKEDGKGKDKDDKPKMKIIKIKSTYNTIENKGRNHHGNLRRDKKLNTEANIKKAKFSESIKPKINYNYNTNKPEIVDIRATFNPGLTEDYKKRNNLTIENIHNKEKLVINEYQTKDKDKKNLKNYKTEYIWDKNINRLVEKRIFFDKDDKNINNSINYSNKYRNILNDEDNTLSNEKEKEKENITEVKIEPEEKPEKIKVNLKLKKVGDDSNKKSREKNIDLDIDLIPKDKNDNNEVKKIEIRKRLGDSQLIYKKIEKEKKDEPNKEQNLNKTFNININNTENPNKELNRSHRYHRRVGNYNTENKEPEKPIEKEIVIEQRTVIKPVEEIQEPKKEEEKPIIKEKKQIIEEDTKPINKIYRRRQYYLNKQKDKNNDIKEKEPEEAKKHERNLTEIENNEPKYKKKPLYEPLEEKPTVVYTKKIIVEEKKPVKDTDVGAPEKKFEKYKEKEMPYNKYRKKNIRINMMSENFNDEKDNNKNKNRNNLYSNYLKNAKKPNDKKIYKQARTDSELIEDLEKIENYNINTYLKDDLLQIYDSINEEFSDFKKDIFYTNINSFEINMGEFDKKNIPYFKRPTKADDLCKGRVTTDDMYQKYSKNAKRFEREKKYK